MNAAAAACGRRRRHAQKKINQSHLSRRLAVDDDWTLPGRSGDLLQSHLAHALHVLRDPAFAHAFEFRKSPQILLIVLFFSLSRGGSVLSRGGRRGEPPHRRGIDDCGHFFVLFSRRFFCAFFGGKKFLFFSSLFCFFLQSRRIEDEIFNVRYKNEHAHKSPLGKGSIISFWLYTNE